MAAVYGADQREVIEGFLCPVCLIDQGSLQQLQAHHEVAHAVIEDTSSTSLSLRDLLDKAKRKILNREEDDQYDSSSPEDLGQDTAVYIPQEIGVWRSHLDYFKAVRSSRTDRYVLETNKLLNRLDKLLTDLPSDPVKKKAHEKSIVIWAADRDVPFCPNCAKAFSIMRRKHHCRLCGAIQCAQCSQFLLHSYAKKLTNRAEDADSTDDSGQLGLSASHLLSFAMSLPRSGSSSSLNSIINTTTGEMQIRVCPQCKQLLDRRDEMIRMQVTKPEIVQVYERIRSLMDEVISLHDVYVRQCVALKAGETNCNLKDAQEVRMKLLKLAEAIQLYGKRILALGIKDGDVKAFSKAIQLQRAIYLSTNNFLKEKIVCLPALPTDEEVIEYREQRQFEVQKRIEREKAAAVELQRKTDQRRPETPSRRENRLPKQQIVTSSHFVPADSGWGPSIGAPRVMDDEDPIVQQMNIIRNYIRQAKEVQKMEEVQMLEANLRELQDEYWKQEDVGYAG